MTIPATPQGTAPEIKVFPVAKLEDTPASRLNLRMIRNGLSRPSMEGSRAMAMEILRLWGDPDWNKY